MIIYFSLARFLWDAVSQCFVNKQALKVLWVPKEKKGHHIINFLKTNSKISFPRESDKKEGFDFGLHMTESKKVLL